jgi:NADH-quinone oxidoreductase subunit H
MAAVAIFLVAGSLSLNAIVADQGGAIWMWNAVRQPLAFLIFLTALFAESNRLPFDLPEGEAEIVGYHVEYSSMRFAMFFMAEYAHIVVGSAIVAALFLGGWHIPFVGDEAILSFFASLVPGSEWFAPVATAVVQFAVMIVKTLVVCAVFIWVRWTLPRFRYDQLMAFGWKFLLPLAIVNVVITAFAVVRITG